jgi:Flp pilus assembly protein TadD
MAPSNAISMDRRRLAAIALLLILAVGFAYANSLNVDFTYDDYAFVYNNEEIRSFSPLSKFLLSSKTFAHPANDHVYRPLAAFTFAINYAVGGLTPTGYHLTNLLFHLLNAFLVFFLLRRLGFDDGPSCAGALIFAIHPVHTEAVTWISGRGNVLFLFFFLIAYMLYTNIDTSSEGNGGDGSRTPRKFLLLLGSLVAYALSLLAKEMALPLPLLLFGHDAYFHRDWSRGQWLKRVWLYVPFVLVAIIYVVLRTYVLGKVGQVSYHGGSAYVTFLAMLQAAVTYVRLLFVPVGLSLSRHFEPSYSLFEAAVFPSFCLVVLGIALGIITFRRGTFISFSLFWFAVAMLPVSNIIPVNALVADRFLYGPSIGCSILLAAGLATVRAASQQKRTLATTGLALIVFCFMILSTARNNDWHNSISLWRKATQASPTSYVAFNNLGMEHMKHGQIPEAIDALNEAVRIKDDFPEAHANLGICYTELGDFSMASKHYEAALGSADRSVPVEIRYKLAELYERRGRIELAIKEYEAVLNKEPDFLRAHRRLAHIYTSLDVEKAIAHYETIVLLAPDDSDAYYKLGQLYYSIKNLPHARRSLLKCLDLNPNNDAARRFLEEIEKNPISLQNSD